MRKKLIIIALAVVTLITTALSPLAFTVTDKLPDNLSAVPVEYISLRAYDGKNELRWLNLPDQRIARTLSTENLNYSEYTTLYMPNGKDPITTQFRTLITSNYATMYFQLSEYISGERYFANNSYVQFALEPIGVTPYSNPKDFIVMLEDFNGNSLSTYAELKYTRTVVNNTTGKIQRRTYTETLTPKLEYTAGLGNEYIVRASFPAVGNTAAVYDDISLRVYYSGELTRFGISSASQNSVSRNRDNRAAMEYIGRVSGQFDPVEIPSDWFGWIVDGVDGFMQFQILPNVTLWTVFYAGLGLLLFVIIMKKFAGG